MARLFGVCLSPRRSARLRRRVPQQRAHDVDAGNAVFKSGRQRHLVGRGVVADRAGSAAAPQPQAFGPSQGRSEWFSQTQWVPSQRAHVTSGPTSMRWGLFLDLLPVQMVEHIAEVTHIQHLAADGAADEVVTVALRRRAFSLPSLNIMLRPSAAARAVRQSAWCSWRR
jgi:hypothetical protein